MAHAGAQQGEGRPLQLALALDHAESFAREDFLVGPSNAAALDLIERWPDWPDRIMVLVGPQGSGKSHLAAIWAAAAGARTAAARSLDSAAMPAAFATGALVVEDLAERRFDERTLFHLINHAREERAFVLVTARSAPTSWNIGVADLASRLRVLPAIELAAPDDALLRAIIVKLFADRQLAVEESLIGYLAARIERTFAGAQKAVDALDREALRQKRPVSRALAVEQFRVP
jgi:chromosomal replication initiation ATPase DnaA